MLVTVKVHNLNLRVHTFFVYILVFIENGCFSEKNILLQSGEKMNALKIFP